MDSGKEQNYWPGFVDALSNVVLTLVFVLVILVFALAMASNKVSQKIQEISQQKTQASQMKENTTLKQQVAEMAKEIEQLKKETASDQNNKNTVDAHATSTQNEDKQIEVEEKDKKAAQNQGAVDIKNESNTVVLNYPLSVAEMDQKSEEQLGHVLEAVQQKIGKHKVQLRSIIGMETYSVARRMAYYRAVNARNQLITKLGYAPSDIEISIIIPPQPQDGRVEIIFKK